MRLSLHNIKDLRDAFRKKRKKFQTIVKKVGGGDTKTQNKNWKLILDKSIRREGAKSVCQNFNKTKYFRLRLTDD